MLINRHAHNVGQIIVINTVLNCEAILKRPTIEQIPFRQLCNIKSYQCSKDLKLSNSFTIFTATKRTFKIHHKPNCRKKMI